jgi:predicted RNase H-like HicB family nuclease
MTSDIVKRAFRLIFPHQNPYEIKKKYHLPVTLDLNVKLTPEGWFVATSPDLPGMVTQAKSKDDLIEMINDAVLTYFDVPKREADIVYDQFRFGGETIQYRGELATKAA